MHIATGMTTGPHTEKASIRKPGVDFDQEGSRSTLAEMLNLGGLFPLARIADRLPFPKGTLKRWAKRGPFSGCFILPCAGSSKGTASILVHLNLLEDQLKAMIQQASIEEEERHLAEVSSIFEIIGDLAI